MDQKISREVNELLASLNSLDNELNSIINVIKNNSKNLGLDKTLKNLESFRDDIRKNKSKLNQL